MIRTLLLVAYHFPPENEIGAARPARFVKYLRREGWDCQVLTAAPQEHFQADVHYVEDPTRTVWRGGELGEPKAPASTKYSELVLRRFLFPGVPGLTWWRDVSTEAVRIARGSGEAPAAVLSSFPPLPVHLAASRIAKRLRVPWIADYRDPLPHRVFNGAHRLAARAYQAMEARFFRDAAAIILNTEATAAMYRALYPMHAGKMHVIWNGFDPEDAMGPLPVPPRPSRILSHVGTLYGGRNPGAILESLERLRSAGDKEALRSEIFLAGPKFSSPEEQAALDRCAALGWVNVQDGVVPQAEARKLTQQSDGLLLLQPQSAIQVPGKLFEYVRTGRPILSLAPRNSPIEWILRRSGIRHTSLYPDEPSGETDRKIAEFLRGDWNPSTPSDWFQTNFDAARQAGQLAEIVNRVTDGHSA